MKQFLNKALLSLAGMGLAASGLVGCSDNGLETYEIDAPADLEQRIEAANSEKDAADATFEPETVTSQGFWTAWSKNIPLAVNKRAIVKMKDFKNAGMREAATGDATKEYDNIVLVCTKAGWTTRNADDGTYTEVGCLRMDGGFWGGAASVKFAEDSKKYLEMVEDGASVEWIIDHYSNGAILVTCNASSSKGDMSWSGEAASTPGPLLLFFTGEYSQYTIESVEYEDLVDMQPVSIEFTGAIEAVEMGSKDFKGDKLAAFVVWENGSKTPVKLKDLNFVVTGLDENNLLNTIGQQTVIATYSKTSMGNITTKAAAGSYVIEVTAAISDIDVETVEEPTYYYAPGTTEIKKEDVNIASFIKSVIGKTGTADINIPATEYKAEVTTATTSGITIKVTFKDFSKTFNVACKQLEPEIVDLVGQTVGDESTDSFNAVFSPSVMVVKGQKISYKFTVTTNLTEPAAWNYFCFSLCSNDVAKEGYVIAKNYGLFRSDQYCWYDPEGFGKRNNWDGDPKLCTTEKGSEGLDFHTMNNQTVSFEMDWTKDLPEVNISWTAAGEEKKVHSFSYTDINTITEAYCYLTFSVDHAHLTFVE